MVTQFIQKKQMQCTTIKAQTACCFFSNQSQSHWKHLFYFNSTAVSYIWKYLHVQCGCPLQGNLCGYMFSQKHCEKSERYLPKGHSFDSEAFFRAVISFTAYGGPEWPTAPIKPEPEGNEPDATATWHQLLALLGNSLTYSWHGSYSELANCRYSRRNLLGTHKKLGYICARLVKKTYQPNTKCV